MKTFILLLLLIGPLTLIAQVATDLPSLTINHTININDLIPEGIAYDPVKKDFYVGSTYKRKIIRINSDGTVEDFINEQQDNIKGVLGLEIDEKNRVLWALSADVGNYMPVKNSDTTEIGQSFLHKYDLNSGKLIKKYILNDSGVNYFLNDLTLDNFGNLYITETIGQKIYKLSPEEDELKVYLSLPEKHYPNGIDISEDGKFLFVALYADPKPKYGKIDLKTGNISYLSLPEGADAGADGLYFYNNSLIGILPGSENDRVIQYFLNEACTEVRDFKVHVQNHELLEQPTTGVVVGDRFYFIATSNLQLFARLYRESEGVVDSNELQPLRIASFQLE